MKIRINVETDNVLISKGDICKVVQENIKTYFIEHNGMVLQMLKCDCEIVEEEKEIELPNEFYFKEVSSDNIFMAIKNTFTFDIYSVDKDHFYCDYNKKDVEKNVKVNSWVIIDKPVVDKVDVNKENTIKKVSKFIKLTTKDGFINYVAKDKIVNVIEYEGQTFITTVTFDGDCIVIEKAENIIKMLEE